MFASPQISKKSLQATDCAIAQAPCDVNKKRHDGHGSYEDTARDGRWHPATTLSDLEILATPTLQDDAVARKSVLPPPMPQSVVLRPSEVAALQQIHPMIRERLGELGRLREATFQQVADLQSACEALRRDDPHNATAIAEASRVLQARQDAYMAMADEERSLSDAAEVLVDCAFMQEAHAQSNSPAASHSQNAGKDLAQILEAMRVKIAADPPTDIAT